MCYPYPTHSYILYVLPTSLSADNEVAYKMYSFAVQFGCTPFNSRYCPTAIIEVISMGVCCSCMWLIQIHIHPLHYITLHDTHVCISSVHRCLTCSRLGNMKYRCIRTFVDEVLHDGCVWVCTSLKVRVRSDTMTMMRDHHLGTFEVELP